MNSDFADEKIKTPKMRLLNFLDGDISNDKFSKFMKILMELNYQDD